MPKSVRAALPGLAEQGLQVSTRTVLQHDVWITAYDAITQGTYQVVTVYLPRLELHLKAVHEGLAYLSRHLPQSQEFQGILLTPAVFHQIHRAERSLAEGFPDAVSAVDDISRLEVTSVYNLIGRTHFLISVSLLLCVNPCHSVAQT